MHPDIKTPDGRPHIVGVIFRNPQVENFLKAAGVGDALDPDFQPLLTDQAVAYLKVGGVYPVWTCDSKNFSRFLYLFSSKPKYSQTSGSSPSVFQTR